MPQSLAETLALSFSLEVELLLCCARTYMDPAMADRLRRLLREDLDWESVIRIARLHGIIPLLHLHLHHTCLQAVPKAIFDQLHHDVHANTLNNFFLIRELLKLLALFEAHGIPAIPYKGPILAAAVYGNLALRQFNDLDIVVHKPDVRRAKDLLISRGYRPWRQLTAAQESAHLQ